MRDNPKLSIIIPVLNNADQIMKAIHSARSQSYKNIEIIVVDGGSTDGTLDILTSTDLIDLLIKGPDRGQSDALNKGFSHATGDVFYWLNGDDILLPDAVSWCMELFIQNKKTKVVYGAWNTISENGETIDHHLPLPVSTPVSAISPLKVYNQSLFWRADIHPLIGEFDIALHLLMDVDFVIRLIKTLSPEEFRLTQQTIGAFRIREGQKTGSRFAKNRLKEEKIIQKKHTLPSLYSPWGMMRRTTSRIGQFKALYKAGGGKYMLKELKNMVKKI